MTEQHAPDELPADLKIPLLRLWTATEQIIFSMLPRDVWLSVAVLQLAARNPTLTADQRATIERLARALQGVLTQIDPIIGKYIEMGWDPANDVPRQEHL